MNWAANRATKGLGTSFKGVSAYLLSPKHEGQTLEERVAFTACRNLATDDPTRAWRLMAETALRRDQLKQLAGGSAAGRKVKDGEFKPVFHYSLAWHPDQQPDPAEMERAAIGSLRALKLEHHEALIVAHRDEGHAHLHVVVNRVDPDTGKSNALPNAFRKLDRWAAEYERETGVIVSHAREEKHRAIDEGRTRPEPDKRWLPHDEWTQARAADHASGKSLNQEERDTLWASQSDVRKDLLEAAKVQARLQAQALRERQRPGWAELGRGQHRCQAELVNALDNRAGMTAFINRHNELLQKAWTDPAEREAGWASLLTRGGLTAAVERAQAFETAEFRRDVTHDRHVMQREFWADYRQQIDRLRVDQAAARAQLPQQQRQHAPERITETRTTAIPPTTEIPEGRRPDVARPAAAAPRAAAPGLRYDPPATSVEAQRHPEREPRRAADQPAPERAAAADKVSPKVSPPPAEKTPDERRAEVGISLGRRHLHERDRGRERDRDR